MPRRYPMLAILFALTILASACAPQIAATAIPATSAPAAATAMPPTSAPASAATSVPVTGATSAAAAPTGPAHVALGTNAQLGSFLVDDKGMTLYMFTTDKPNTSNCYGKCASFWPPLLTSGAPVGGSGLDASKFGTTTRTDGTVQVTYNSWPLYYFAKDKQAGDVKGQNVGGTWFVISSSGDPIQK